MIINFSQRNYKLRKSFKTFTNDLLSLPKSIKMLIYILISLIVINSIFDFNHFIDLKSYPSIWIFENNNDYPIWKKAFLILSAIASISHIICNILLAYGKISNFIWGTIGVTSYGVYTIAWGYLGDMQLNLFFFLPMQLLGYKMWKKHLNDNNSLTIHKLNLGESLLTLYSIAIIGMIFYFEIPQYAKFTTGSYIYAGNNLKNIIPHLFDATTNALSIVGQILMLLRYREQWIMWMMSNLLQLAMFAGVGNGKVNVNMIVLWLFAIVNALIGLKKWFTLPARKRQRTILNWNFIT